MGSEEIQNIIQRELPRLKSSFHVARLALFGSCVTGGLRPDSDLDVLVDFEEAQDTFDNYMDLKYLLEELFCRKVDLVVSDTIKPALRDSILRSARYVQGA